VRRQHLLVGACLLAVLALSAGGCLSPAMAQAQAQPSGPPNALQGFSQNRDKPVQIDAATLEVRDKDKVATFLGNVRMIQGDTTMHCKTLFVYYDQDANPGTLTAAKPGPGGQQQIKRLEAKGNVIVTQKADEPGKEDQTATGDNGVFDMKANTVTLIGGVVVSQGQNVLRGERLVVDLTTGVSRMEGGKVQGLFMPSSSPDAKPGDTKPAKCSGPGCTGNQSAGATNTTATGHDAPKVHPTGPSGLY
jgi:lipopolysaccharide export system protein LptA